MCAVNIYSLNLHIKKKVNKGQLQLQWENLRLQRKDYQTFVDE